MAPRQSLGGGVLVLAGILLIVAVGINQTAIHWRTDLADGHLFAYYGWCVAHGARPYVDVWDNKPPGIWWANALAITLCGPNESADVLLGTVALAVTLVAVVGIARTVWHKSLVVFAALAAGVILTLPRYECGGNRTETFVCACESLAMLGYVRWRLGGRTPWLIVAGLAAGCAPLFKQAGVAALGAAALHLAWAQWRGRTTPQPSPIRPVWRPWLIGGLAFLLPPVAAALVLAVPGGLGEALFAVGRFNQAYFAVNDATWVHLDRAFKVLQPELGTLVPAFVLAGLGLLCAGGTGVRRLRLAAQPAPQPAGVGLFALWFVLAAYLALVGPGRRGYHFMPALPALTLLTIYPLQWLAGQPGLGIAIARRGSVALAVAAWVYVLGLVASDNGADTARCWRGKASWWGLHFAQPRSDELQGRAIAAYTEPDDTIYVWGWDPGAYRYAQRRPASRFATIEKLGQVGRQADFIVRGAMEDNRRHPPRVFMIPAAEHDAIAARPGSSFDRWMLTQYEPRETIDGMRILLRRTAAR